MLFLRSYLTTSMNTGITNKIWKYVVIRSKKFMLIKINLITDPKTSKFNEAFGFSMISCITLTTYVIICFCLYPIIQIFLSHLAFMLLRTMFSLLAFGHATRSVIVENQTMIDKTSPLEAMQFSLFSKIHQNSIIANL